MTVLAALLLGSLVINLSQARSFSALETRSQEYQQALADAVDRIDAETARADLAEAALGRVEGAVEAVDEQMTGLRAALERLREATQP